MQYTTKVKIVLVALPTLTMLAFAAAGYPASRLLFAQAPLPAGVGVTTDQPKYRVGQTVTVLLFNTSARNMHVLNNCPAEPLAVYRLEQGKWIRLHARASPSKCNGESRDYEIASGRIVQFDYSYWPSLFSKPGAYRIAADFESYSNEATADLTIVR